MPTIHAVPAADLELLRKYDTPTICNVVELFDHCAAHAPATWTAASRPAIRSCRRWSVTPPRRRSAPASPPRVGQRLFRPRSSRWRRSRSCPGRPVVVFQDLDSPVAVGDVRRGDVHHLQGVRRGRPDHQRGRPRSRSGRGARISPASPTAPSAPTATATSCRSTSRSTSAAS